MKIHSPGYVYTCSVQDTLNLWEEEPSLEHLDQNDSLLFLPDTEDPRNYQVAHFNQSFLTWTPLCEAYITEIPLEAKRVA